jgi:hypothetical protein
MSWASIVCGNHAHLRCGWLIADILDDRAFTFAAGGRSSTVAIAPNGNDRKSAFQS